MKSLLEIVADSCTNTNAADNRIRDRLFSYPWFCYKYQLHRLRNLMPEQLGADLSGSAQGGIVYYPPDVAADLLCQYAGQVCAAVGRPHPRLPYTEGNLSFRPLTKNFVLVRKPVVFFEGRPRTIEEFSARRNLTVMQAADEIIKIVEDE